MIARGGIEAIFPTLRNLERLALFDGFGGARDQAEGIETAEDAEAYLSRLSAFPTALDQETERMLADFAAGAVPPDFVIDKTLLQLANLHDTPAAESIMTTSVQRRATEKSIPGDWAARAERIVQGEIYPALVRQAEAMKARRAEAAARGKVAGIAAAYYFERTGGGPAESALMDVKPDGEITLAVGTQSSGQGHETVWPQIVHEELGVDPMKIRLLAGDSDLLTAVGGTGGSRSLIMASRVLMLAAKDVIEKAKDGASALLEAAKADIEYTVEDGGRFRIAGTDRSVTLFEAASGRALCSELNAGVLGHG